MHRMAVILLSLLYSHFALSAKVRAHYIDLGHADATLLEFDCAVALIDAGSQRNGNWSWREPFSPPRSSQLLMKYLDDFFYRRPDLNNTIETILITHNHNDHTGSLDDVAAKYTIKNIVSTEYEIGDDVTGVVSGEANIKHRYLTYTDAKSKIPNGLFYSEIDPISCQSGDPVIKVFTGQSDITSTLTINDNTFRKSHFESPNNHSLVITVEYGKASFIFTGDLEKKGVEYLLANYKDHLDIINVDVYQVGHHGSKNATSLKLLEAVSPKISIISAGHTDRKGTGTAWDYGYPDKGAVQLLQTHTSGVRIPSIRGLLFDGQETDPLGATIEKQVYCTCWDHTIIVEADYDTGNYKIITNQ